MKKMVLFLLIMTMAFVSYSAKKTKITSKVYTGEYVKSTNTFTYKKDNLVFKDKILYVGQHDFLFIDTILNNLTLGSKEID